MIIAEKWLRFLFRRWSSGTDSKSQRWFPSLTSDGSNVGHGKGSSLQWTRSQIRRKSSSRSRTERQDASNRRIEFESSRIGRISRVNSSPFEMDSFDRWSILVDRKTKPNRDSRRSRRCECSWIAIGKNPMSIDVNWISMLERTNVCKTISPTWRMKIR